MDVSASSIVGSIRLGLNVVTNQKVPMLEIYPDLRFIKHRPIHAPETVSLIIEKPSELYFHFFLINIGGKRAENVKLFFEMQCGDDKLKKDLSDMNLFNKSCDCKVQISQIVPAQRIHLLTLCILDGIKPGIVFEIKIQYTSPDMWSKIFHYLTRKNKGYHYETIFKFDTSIYDGLSLPPAEYV